MGQQQLLLVILVTIIVGIATVVAINIFNVSAQSANRDSVRQDMLSIASAAQSWYFKPRMMGGGNNSFTGLTFRGLSFPAEKINATGTQALNLNGRYVIDPSAGNSFTITAHPASDPNYDRSQEFNATANQILTLTVEKDKLIW